MSYKSKTAGYGNKNLSKGRLTNSRDELAQIDEFEDNQTRVQSAMSRTQYSQNGDNLYRSTGMDDMSVVDSSSVRRIAGLTTFLKEEHMKRLGIFTEDKASLITFWKDYVSKHFRDMREQRKYDQEQRLHVQTVQQADMMGLESLMMELDLSPGKANTATKRNTTLTPKPKSSLKPPMTSTKKGDKLVTHPTKPFTFKENYEKFELLPECDVAFTLEKDLEEEENTRIQKALKMQMTRDNRDRKDTEDRLMFKIKNMLEIYYEDKALRCLRTNFYKKYKLNELQKQEIETE
jgi:hypothetical protein